MTISEVRIKLVNRPNDKLRAFCTITIDNAMVVRDIKIIDGAKGPFVAMPSRKLTDRCPKCGGKNHLRSNFCNDCGARLPVKRKIQMEDGRHKLYADVAHPIHAAGREVLSERVIKAFHEELERSKLPGYQPQELYGDDDAFEDDDYAGRRGSEPPAVAERTAPAAPPPAEKVQAAVAAISTPAVAKPAEPEAPVKKARAPRVKKAP